MKRHAAGGFRLICAGHSPSPPWQQFNVAHVQWPVTVRIGPLGMVLAKMTSAAVIEPVVVVVKPAAMAALRIGAGRCKQC
jgi:hypothetical protein